jgi:hypothetical protein
MTTTLNTDNLSLRDVYRLLGFQEQPMGSYTDFLNLEPLNESEQQDLIQIATDFKNYLTSAKVSEGLIKALTVYPLLRLAGYYRFPVELHIEEAIERITVDDEDTHVTGRFDILAVNRDAEFGGQPFWILIVEAKNSTIATNAGLPQLLTYAYQSLSHQDSVWGLLTNGLDHQFVRLTRGSSPTYQVMPLLQLSSIEQATQLLQILKAIHQLKGTMSNSAVA